MAVAHITGLRKNSYWRTMSRRISCALTPASAVSAHTCTIVACDGGMPYTNKVCYPTGTYFTRTRRDIYTIDRVIATLDVLTYVLPKLAVNTFRCVQPAD